MIDLSRARIVAVANLASGSADERCEALMTGVFAAAGCAHAEIVAATPDRIAAALADAASRADVLVVLGGDGTIGAAANLCTAKGPVLVPLPGGTMNMLPKALYGERDWLEALADTLRAPAERTIGAGLVGDTRFLCAAILGAPSLWAEAREAMRELNLIEAAGAAVTAARASLADSVDYAFAGHSGRAGAVLVMTPLVSAACDEIDPRLEAAAFEVGSVGDMLELAVKSVVGEWRETAAVTRALTESVAVHAGDAIPAICDGERIDLPDAAHVTYLAEALRVLVPQ